MGIEGPVQNNQDESAPEEKGGQEDLGEVSSMGRGEIDFNKIDGRMWQPKDPEIEVDPSKDEDGEIGGMGMNMNPLGSVK